MKMYTTTLKENLALIIRVIGLILIILLISIPWEVSI